MSPGDHELSEWSWSGRFILSSTRRFGHISLYSPNLLADLMGLRGNGRAGGQRNGRLPACLVNFGTPPLGSLDRVVCPLLGIQTHWQRPQRHQGEAATLADEEVTCWDVSLGYFSTWSASASQTHPAAILVQPGSPSISVGSQSQALTHMVIYLQDDSQDSRVRLYVASAFAAAAGCRLNTMLSL